MTQTMHGPPPTGPVPRAPGPAGAAGDQFLMKCVNNEEYPLRVKWDSVEYWLHPGVATFIPTPAAWLFFGDPRSTDVIQAVKDVKGQVAYIPDRASEVRRLRIKYGAGIEGDESNFDTINIPSVTVTTVNDDPIVTVLDDPTGRSVTPVVQTQTSDDALRALIAEQARQIQALTAHLGLDNTTTAAEESQLPADGEPLGPGVIDLTGGQ